MTHAIRLYDDLNPNNNLIPTSDIGGSKLDNGYIWKNCYAQRNNEDGY